MPQTYRSTANGMNHNTSRISDWCDRVQPITSKMHLYLSHSLGDSSSFLDNFSFIDTPQSAESPVTSESLPLSCAVDSSFVRTCIWLRTLLGGQPAPQSPQECSEFEAKQVPFFDTFNKCLDHDLVMRICQASQRVQAYNNFLLSIDPLMPP